MSANDANIINLEKLARFKNKILQEVTQEEYKQLTPQQKADVTFFIKDSSAYTPAAASEVSFDNTGTGMSATNVQAAIVEVNSEKMDKENPSGTGSFSLNRTDSTVGLKSFAAGNSVTATGNYAHAEGSSTTASGESSHAEGYLSTANNYYAHAEGSSSTASGQASHAEGLSTTASDSYAHAEGRGTTASGKQSHAEGMLTTASGENAHVEGYGPNASGLNSHAEGTSTTANHKSQHTFGEFNVADNSSNLATERGNYVEIVGNGTDSNNRSNARTLDWNGNETLAGKLTLGATPTNNMDAATKQYVDSAISTAITNALAASY